MTSLARHGHPENPKPAARHDSKRLVDNDVTIIDGDVIITDSDVIIRPYSRCLVVPNYCKNTERRHDCWRRLCRDIYQIEIPGKQIPWFASGIWVPYASNQDFSTITFEKNSTQKGDFTLNSHKLKALKNAKFRIFKKRACFQTLSTHKISKHLDESKWKRSQ